MFWVYEVGGPDRPREVERPGEKVDRKGQPYYTR